MKPKRHPSPEEFTMLAAMFNPDPAEWDNWVRSQGLEPVPDLPECLANTPSHLWQDNTKVMPTPGIQRYLDSGDVLNQFTIDQMELALENAYQVTDPWYITSFSSGSEEEGNLALDYFYLCRKV